VSVKCVELPISNVLLDKSDLVKFTSDIFFGSDLTFVVDSVFSDSLILESVWQAPKKINISM
jgi:hypothetical protein